MDNGDNNRTKEEKQTLSSSHSKDNVDVASTSQLKEEGEVEEGEIKESPLESKQLSITQLNVILRTRTLNALMDIVNHPVEVQLKEKTNVTGICRCLDAAQEYLQISNLQTPMYFYEEAVIRSKDILSVRVLTK